ncbi:uncharacterized protein LOC119114399 [Pollicipes pollicipes]|uniref:uncharacterized protein LOC119114399 n=1 Tax=Pollicipes pollicipes TaxID=41117 RepID=UPI001884BF6D|nr:uncharacterized protein LOC119114399 [Pollicipes pollicipes]
MVKFVIRPLLPRGACLIGKIFLIDSHYKALGQGPENIQVLELGYLRRPGKRSELAHCQVLPPEDIDQHDWLNDWLRAAFPGRRVRRVYPAPFTGRSWPKTMRALHRAARIHTANGGEDSYAILFLSSLRDVLN